MHINKISNTSFKGAYFVVGKGEDVRKVQDILKYGITDLDKNNDMLMSDDTFNRRQHCPREIEGSINTIGAGYTVNHFPAFLLVTTGSRDKNAYNNFIKNENKYYKEEVEKNPANFSKKDFAGRISQWVEKKCNYEGKIWMEAIKNNCRFKKKPKTLDASKVLSALQQQKFDYINGKIYKNTINIEDVTLE